MKQSAYTQKITKVCRLIETAEEMPRLNDLAQSINLSPYHFHRVFKDVTGVTPKEYADAHRTRKVASQLRKGAKVTEAIYDAGYNSGGNFYADSTQRLGMTPKAYKKGGANETIRFAVAQSSLGAVLVAATEKGICAITIDDDADTLVKDLQDRFPKAELIGADKGFEKTVAQVIGLVEDPTKTINLPLDIRGTAFQQKVWKALRKIPAGKTVSYTDIAEKIGSPQSVRAVAGACAANKIAIAVPCHRVVRTDGDLSGYRWGVARKCEILKRESK